MPTPIRTLLLAAAVLCPAVASAHAFLDHAVPGVGASVTVSPAELTLTFTQTVVAALSHVTLAAKGGGAVPLARATSDAADPAVLHARLGKGLAPGAYVVTWHVVAIDTHPTSGTYTFTVAP